MNPLIQRQHNHSDCIHNALANAEATCRDKGLRMTPLRLQVLELVWASHEPVKAYDLLDQLKALNFNSAPPTVYRALDFLLNAGLVHRIASLNAYIGCNHPQTAHHAQFFICDRCHSVAEMDATDINTALRREAKSCGFHIQSPTVEIHGVCQSCR